MDPTPDRAQLRRRMRRRMSTPTGRQPTHFELCKPLPHSIQALDLSAASPYEALASLRYITLSYLGELEARLSELESPDLEAWKIKGELTIEEARAWTRTALEMLNLIRTDVYSHLPDLPDMSVEQFVKSHLPDFDLADVPSLDDVRARLPDMPDIRSRISEIRLSDIARSSLDDVKSKFNDIHPLDYIPVLSERLDSLRSHLTSMEIPTTVSFAPSTILSELIDSLISSDIMQELLKADDIDDNRSDGGDSVFETVEKAAIDIAHAIKNSFDGVRLIHYSDLPEAWRSNPFVTHGYRFIPLERWPLIIMSLFALHNETLNIHTHLIPFILWTINSLPILNSNSSLSDVPVVDTPERLFMSFALLCLFCSAVWHTMSGCGHAASMEFCARVDYVGIGWLISASVGTVVYYGYECNPTLGNYFLGLCFVMGVLGSVFPFMAWFNTYKYRGWRMLFFLSLAFSAVAPLTGIAMLHSTNEMFKFMAPVVPSLVSYIAGLFFYATHVPERWIPEKWSRRLDTIGGGSHCIWHCFIVLAVSQHKAAIASLREGLPCPAH